MQSAALALLFLLLGTGIGLALPSNEERAASPFAPNPTIVKWQGQRFFDVSDRREVPCPANAITVLVLGQSNAANSVGERFASTVTFDRLAGKCYPAGGPTLGSSGNAGSIWPLVGDEVHRANGRSVVLVGMAISGTTVSEWVQQTEPNGYIARELRKLQDVPVDFITWHQGEAEFATAPAAYERDLRTVSGRLREMFPKAHLLVAQTSLCATHSPRSEIRAAQAAVLDGKGVLLGPNTDLFADFDDRYDGCHFSGPGARKVARGWARSLLSALGS